MLNYIMICTLMLCKTENWLDFEIWDQLQDSCAEVLPILDMFKK